jgi:hypothetical protein
MQQTVMIELGSSTTDPVALGVPEAAHCPGTGITAVVTANTDVPRVTGPHGVPDLTGVPGGLHCAEGSAERPTEPAHALPVGGMPHEQPVQPRSSRKPV